MDSKSVLVRLFGGERNGETLVLSSPAPRSLMLMEENSVSLSALLTGGEPKAKRKLEYVFKGLDSNGTATYVFEKYWW